MKSSKGVSFFRGGKWVGKGRPGEDPWIGPPIREVLSRETMGPATLTGKQNTYLESGPSKSQRIGGKRGGSER